MDEQRLDDQLELIYNSSVRTHDVAWRTCRERWTIETGGEKGSGRSVLAVWHDDDDDDDISSATSTRIVFLSHLIIIKVTYGILIRQMYEDNLQVFNTIVNSQQ